MNGTDFIFERCDAIYCQERFHDLIGFSYHVQSFIMIEYFDFNNSETGLRWLHHQLDSITLT